jgi:hypothetical protein
LECGGLTPLFVARLDARFRPIEPSPKSGVEPI